MAIRSISGTAACGLWYDNANMSGGRTYYKLHSGDMRLTVIEFSDDLSGYTVLERGTEISWTVTIGSSPYTEYLYFTETADETATKAPDKRFLHFYGNVHGVEPFAGSPYLGTAGNDYEILRWHSGSDTNYRGRTVTLSPVVLDLEGDRLLGLLWESAKTASGTIDRQASLMLVRPLNDQARAKTRELPVTADTVESLLPHRESFLMGYFLGLRLKNRRSIAMQIAAGFADGVLHIEKAPAVWSNGILEVDRYG